MSSPDRPADPSGLPAAGRSVVLAYNPASGRFRGALLRRLEAALRKAGHRVTCRNSRDALLTDSGEQPDLLCAFGGDGTARTLVDRAGDTPLCVYPAGTINLLAREAGYPADPDAFAARLGAGAARRMVHFGRIGEEPFLCCASVGPDAEAVAGVSEALKARIGRLAYGVAALRQIGRWPRRAFTFTVDGVAIAGEAMFVCKARYYAGPWVIDEEARLESDRFRVLILPRAGRRDMIRLALAAIVHPLFSSPAWHRLPATTITVASDTPAPVQADGDIVAHTPVNMTVAPFFLNFL